MGGCCVLFFSASFFDVPRTEPSSQKDENFRRKSTVVAAKKAKNYSATMFLLLAYVRRSTVFKCDDDVVDEVTEAWPFSLFPRRLGFSTCVYFTTFRVSRFYYVQLFWAQEPEGWVF